MRILVLGKIPPIEGGASNLTFSTCCDLSMVGHIIDVVSDANEVEAEMKEIGIKYKMPKNSKKINIHYIKKLDHFYQYPGSNLRSERLFGLASDLISKHNYDLIIGWYMIPYGKISVDLGLIYNIKSLIVHGGSDLLTLSKHKNLRHTISYILKHSTAIITANNRRIHNMLIGFGADNSKIINLNRAFPLPKYITEKSKTLSIKKITEIVQDEIQTNYKSDTDLQDIFKITSKYRTFSYPTIILYGKVGEGKKTIEILRILNELKERGLKFNFIGLFCGSRKELYKSLNYFLNNTNLLNRSIILPPIAPWLIPSILDKVDIGICSEVSFGVLNHMPILPREMIKFGIVPIVSEDIYKSPFYKWIIQDEMNALVAHKNDFEKPITKLITSDLLMKKLKSGALITSKSIEKSLELPNEIVEIVNNLTDGKLNKNNA